MKYAVVFWDNAWKGKRISFMMVAHQFGISNDQLRDMIYKWSIDRSKRFRTEIDERIFQITNWNNYMGIIAEVRKWGKGFRTLKDSENAIFTLELVI